MGNNNSRLLSYKGLVEVFGQTTNYWRYLYYKDIIKNCNPCGQGKHLFDEKDIVKLIEETKAA
ncbi:MAG: hypothetical protein GY714_12415 [Desulfobacterales bacterium]|nr:hypothetical protein [Desulfobacterales bacterium]